MSFNCKCINRSNRFFFIIMIKKPKTGFKNSFHQKKLNAYGLNTMPLPLFLNINGYCHFFWI